MDGITAWVAERIPKDEDLTRPALTELATELGKVRSLWEQHVRHDPEQRIFGKLRA